MVLFPEAASNTVAVPGSYTALYIYGFQWSV